MCIYYDGITSVIFMTHAVGSSLFPLTRHRSELRAPTVKLLVGTPYHIACHVGLTVAVTSAWVLGSLSKSDVGLLGVPIRKFSVAAQYL